ncbi:sugar-binding domain-containing protein [Enterococcus faecium]
MTTFRLEEGLKGKQISIHFAGVEQAMFIWLNGHFIGYAEDSFTPSEFDLTPYLEEENILAVEVYKRSTAAFLEDQDFFRFFGIFRDVFLVARGQNHLEDLWIKPRLDDKCQNGKLEVDLSFEQVAKNSQLNVAILDPDGKEIYQQQYPLKEQMTIRIDGFENVALWGHFQPNLYKLELETIDEEKE